MREEGGNVEPVEALAALAVAAESQDREVALPAVAALGEQRSVEAANTLWRIAETHSDKGVRKEARRSLFRLKSLGIVQTCVPQPSPWRPFRDDERPRRIYKAFASPIDGFGNRIFHIGIKKPSGGLRAFVMITNDGSGITHMSGTDTSKNGFLDGVGALRDEKGHLLLVELDPEHYLLLMEEAAARNETTGTPPPPEYEAWKELIGNEKSQLAGPIIYRELDAEEIAADEEFLLQSDSLLGLDEFESWALDEDEAQGYHSRLVEIIEGVIKTSPEAKDEAVEAILGDAANGLVHGEKRSLFQRRLEEMAYILLHTARDREAKRAFAVALSLKTGNVLPVDIPFIRGLVMRSVGLSRPAHKEDGDEIDNDVEGPRGRRSLLYLP